MPTIQEKRKKVYYRILESLLGVISIGFIIFLVILSAVNPIAVSIFLILYNVFWTLKFGIYCFHTIYTHIQTKRWGSQNWVELFANLRNSAAPQQGSNNSKPELQDSKPGFQMRSQRGLETSLQIPTHSLKGSVESQKVEWVKNALDQKYHQTKEFLKSLQKKYTGKIDFAEKIDHDLKVLEYSYKHESKYLNIDHIFQIPIFSIYNEGPEVLIKSLKYIYSCGYDLDRVLVFVSQEDRLGDQKNTEFRQAIATLGRGWINVVGQAVGKKDGEYILVDDFMYGLCDDFVDNPRLDNKKLNIIFTQHPDGLVGEIKGKASNENWGARRAYDFCVLYGHKLNIDLDLSLITSLDADSHVLPSFFHQLSFRYALTKERFKRGFQPVHLYSSNYYETTIWPRLVATSNTYITMTNLGSNENLFFFAIYSVPMRVLEKVDFWEPEVIAEDAVFFIKCFAAYGGDFQVIPFYGIFQGDAVEADDYFESISGQYKQLQRWAWGGVESLPYLIDKMFFDKTIRKASRYSFDYRQSQNLLPASAQTESSFGESHREPAIELDSENKSNNSDENINLITAESLSKHEQNIAQTQNIQVETKENSQKSIQTESEILIQNPTAPLRLRLRIVSFIFNNHFFWTTVPFTLFVATNLPRIFYQETQNQQIKQVYLNLSVLSTYLSWMSIIFLIFSVAIIVNIISRSYNQKKIDLKTLDQKIAEDVRSFDLDNDTQDGSEDNLENESESASSEKKSKKVQNPNYVKLHNRKLLGLPITISQSILVWIQFILSPIIFIFASIPPIDAQIRGVLGKYMGYWVTPKK